MAGRPSVAPSLLRSVIETIRSPALSRYSSGYEPSKVFVFDGLKPPPIAKFPGVTTVGNEGSSEKPSPGNANPCLTDSKSPSRTLCRSLMNAPQLLADNFLQPCRLR